MIRSLDRRWQDHLTEMEELRRAVNLRSYGQKDPLNEYKSEAFKFFEELMANVRTEICHTIFRAATNQQAFETMLSRLAQKVQVAGPRPAAQPGAMAAAAQSAPQAGSAPAPLSPNRSVAEGQPIPRLPKIGRNDTVTIRRGGEELQVKFKKAEPDPQSGLGTGAEVTQAAGCSHPRCYTHGWVETVFVSLFLYRKNEYKN